MVVTAIRMSAKVPDAPGMTSMTGMIGMIGMTRSLGVAAWLAAACGSDPGSSLVLPRPAVERRAPTEVHVVVPAEPIAAVSLKYASNPDTPPP